jgi:hypothetical protein
MLSQNVVLLFIDDALPSVVAEDFFVAFLLAVAHVGASFWPASVFPPR